MSGNEEDKNQKNHENAIERRFLKIEASVSFLFGTVFFFLYDNAIDVYAAESIKSYVLLMLGVTSYIISIIIFWRLRKA